MTTRERLLIAGERIIHERGFSATSVRDITHAASVPLGSFSNHFGSKHAFILEVVERHLLTVRALVGSTLLNEALPPLDRLGAYIDAMVAGLREDHRCRGSLLANLSAEADEIGDATRMRIEETFEELQRALKRCLHAAIIAGDAPGHLGSHIAADLILSAIQGATLIAQVRRDPSIAVNVKTAIFAQIL